LLQLLGALVEFVLQLSVLILVVLCYLLFTFELSFEASDLGLQLLVFVFVDLVALFGLLQGSLGFLMFLQGGFKLQFQL
jgi:hypothetical protein